MDSTGHREPLLTVTDAISAEAEAVIEDGLARFNQERSGIADGRLLAVTAADPATGEVLGGLTGRTSLGLLFVDLFFLPASVRGGGLGGRILRLAEEEAIRRRGSTSATATASSARSTATRQAPAACS